MHDGKANSGPLDFLFLLKRRRVSFDRFCENEGISSREAFLTKVAELESSGEFYVSEEMRQLGLERFPEAQEGTEPEALTDSPSPSADPTPDATGAQEEPTVRKKRSRAV